jgi:hypothetical protein
MARAPTTESFLRPQRAITEDWLALQVRLLPNVLRTFTSELTRVVIAND